MEPEAGILGNVHVYSFDKRSLPVTPGYQSLCRAAKLVAFCQTAKRLFSSCKPEMSLHGKQRTFWRSSGLGSSVACVIMQEMEQAEQEFSSTPLPCVGKEVVLRAEDEAAMHCIGSRLRGPLYFWSSFSLSRSLPSSPSPPDPSTTQTPFQEP